MSLSAVRHILDITPEDLHDNDDRPEPGRLGIHLCCEQCGSRRRWKLPAGRWAIDHTHDGRWTAHILRLAPVPVGLPAADPRREARTFVNALAAVR